MYTYIYNTLYIYIYIYIIYVYIYIYTYDTLFRCAVYCGFLINLNNFQEQN